MITDSISNTTKKRSVVLDTDRFFNIIFYLYDSFPRIISLR